MKLMQKKATKYLADSMLSYFDILQYKNILDFAVQDIKLEEDISSPKSRVDLQNAPHIIEPLKHCVIQKGKRKTITIAFVQQMGKTLIQMIALLYNSVYNKMQAIVLYPSIELATETNATKLIPLFRSIPQFSKDLQQPFAIRSDRLRTSNNLIYFSGCGTKCVSRSCKMTCADQAAVWVNPPQVDNLSELQKRTRSYSQCLNLIVSTPTYKENSFWRQFLKGSQGFYYLRCLNCKQLTMDSSNINNLQFESTYNEDLRQYVVVRGTERLICPKCKHQHTQQDREWMVKNGGYIHKFPDRVQLTPSFQAGALASLLNVHSFSIIADIILSSGKEATLADYVSLDNSIRGLPYQQRQYNKQKETALSKHYYKPQDLKAENIEAIYLVSDTQDQFFPCGVFALDINNNIWLLETHRLNYLWLEDEERKIINKQNQQAGKKPQITMMDLLDRQYYGIKPLMLLQDYRGHNGEYVKRFSSMRKNILMYAGANLKYDRIKVSENNYKMFLCNARAFQADLIFRLYFMNKAQKNYFYLPHDISEDVIQQIMAVQPNNEVRNGNLYQNWTPKQRVHDFFDVCKMALCAVQISAKIFRKERFKHYKADILTKWKKKKDNGVPKPKILPNTAVKKPLFYNQNRYY